MFGDEEIHALREEQIRNLESLLSVKHMEGFKLLITIMSARSPTVELNALSVLKDIGQTLFRLKAAGFNISTRQMYKYKVDVEDTYAGWLDGTIEDWETKIAERRGMTPDPVFRLNGTDSITSTSVLLETPSEDSQLWETSSSSEA